jgi:hypothetical protein
MARRTQTFQAILQEVARGGDRSSLFWFLVKHHDELLGQAEGKRFQWEALCERFAQHGLTDARGETANPKTARQTWLRARKAVAEAKRRKQASDAARRPGAVYPSRISPEWRPTVVPQKAVAAPPMSMPLTAASLPSSPSSPEGPPIVDPRIDTTLPLEAQESLRKLFEQFDEVANSRLKF